MEWNREKPVVVALPEIRDERGALGFVQCGDTCPFPIRRVYYMHDLPVGVPRGSHAHRKCVRLILSMAGTVAVTLETSFGTERYFLDSRRISLLVPALAWITYEAITPGAVLLALASEPYDEADYIRDYTRFIELISAPRF